MNSNLHITSQPFRDADEYMKEQQEYLEAISKANGEKLQREVDMAYAAKQTAEGVINIQNELNVVIHNQNEYIAILKENNMVLTDQLNSLKNILESLDNNQNFQKECLKILCEKQIDVKELAVNKGADVLIRALFEIVPLAFKAMNIL